MFKASHRVENAHESDIWSVVWQGEHLLTAGLDGAVKCRLASSQLKAVEVFPSHRIGAVSAVMLSDASMGIASYQDSSLRFFDLPSMTELGHIEAPLLDAWKICVSPGMFPSLHYSVL